MHVTRVLLASALWLLALPAGAQQLGIKPGLWEKKLTMTTEGAGAPMVVKLKACLKPEDLDAARTLEKMQKGGACTVKRLEVTARRIAIEFRCGETSGRSTTEVKSPERVVVEASIVAGAGGKGSTTRSAEEWTYLRADCAGSD